MTKKYRIPAVFEDFIQLQVLKTRDYAAFLSHVPDADGQLPIQIFRYRLTVNDGVEGMEIDNIQSDMEFEEAYNALLPLIEE